MRNSATGPGSRAASVPAFVFPVAILASAFLIFGVQPMVGKHILPWFGGSPGVWMLCLAFYQSTLFLGYAYAHLLIRRVPPRWQLAWHAALLAGAVAVLPVLPGPGWEPRGFEDPTGRILAMLCANVALPFLALASTGPLVQAWFVRRFPGRSPYPLYAVSNLGSLAALLAYPLWVEPGFPLSAQSAAWTKGFGATALLVLVCAGLARGEGTTAAAGPEVAAADASSGALPPARVLLWLLLSATAVILLMGVTNKLCLDLASVPFLWIVPLALYLTSFIVCFAGEHAYRPGPVALLGATALALHLAVVDWGLLPGAWGIERGSPFVQAAVLLPLLFAACMLLHGELYRLRPPARSLTAFYLCVAGGGALGGLFVGLAAPRLFSDYVELRAGLAVGWGLLLVAWWLRGAFGRGGGRALHLAVHGLLLLGLVGSIAWGAGTRSDAVVLQRRNFFGILRVLEFDADNPARHRRNLRHGTTMHGLQFQSPVARRLPTAYFGRATGIGLAFDHAAPTGPREVGVIGLGVGTLASYGRPGDRFTFYEIDPQVVQIARDAGWFSYLADSEATVRVVVDDGRLALEEELRGDPAPGYDLLVLDAFSSDAIPVHLLTLEAFRTYAQRLRSDGLLAAHLSNQYLDLAPLVLRLGDALGLPGVRIVNRRHGPTRSAASEWVVLGRDPRAIEEFARHAETRRQEYGLEAGALVVGRPSARVADAPLWTDDYSDLFGALRGRPLR